MLRTMLVLAVLALPLANCALVAGAVGGAVIEHEFDTPPGGWCMTLDYRAVPCMRY